MGSREEFIAGLYPAARRVAQDTGMSWELILAQAAQETGWGQRVLPGTNNIFNIKADAGWDGPRRTFNVPEIIDGRRVNVDQDFRVYGSVEESLRDRTQFLRENPRYTRAGLFDEGTAGNFEAEARALQRAGYATDPRYAESLVEVFNGPTMRRGLELAREREAAQGGASQADPAAALLITDPDHPGNPLFTEIGRHVALQTGRSYSPDVIAHVALRAVEGGITSQQAFGRLDVVGDQVYLRGTRDGYRAQADLSAPPVDLREASDKIAKASHEAPDFRQFPQPHRA